MAIIIPHQLSLAPPTCPPSRFQRTASQSTAVRFFVSSNLLSRSLRSASSFPLFRIFFPFGPILPFFCTPLLFSSARFPVSFGLFSCFLWPAPLFPTFRFLFLLVWFYETLPRSQLLSHLVLSPPLSGIFVPLKSDPCPSVLETMPFNVRDNAFLAPRTRPSTFKKTPFSSRLRMCLISCQLQVPFRFIPSSQRRDFRVCSC